MVVLLNSGAGHLAIVQGRSEHWGAIFLNGNFTLKSLQLPKPFAHISRCFLLPEKCNVSPWAGIPLLCGLLEHSGHGSTPSSSLQMHPSAKGAMVPARLAPALTMAKHTWRNAHHPGHKGNATQNHTKIPPHSCQNGYRQELKQLQMLVRIWRERNPHTLLVGMYISTATMKMVWRLLKN
jgi:hypothetical protein